MKIILVMYRERYDMEDELESEWSHEKGKWGKKKKNRRKRATLMRGEFGLKLATFV